MFKWIKQHLRIKKFLGNSENAVKTQVWCAVATYVLIAIVNTPAESMGACTTVRLNVEQIQLVSDVG